MPPVPPSNHRDQKKHVFQALRPQGGIGLLDASNIQKTCLRSFPP